MLLLLVTLRVLIDTYVNPIVPKPPELVGKIPFFDRLSPKAISLLTDWLNDPISLLVSTIIFFLVIVYLIVDLAQNWNNGTKKHQPSTRLRNDIESTDSVPRRFYRAKLGILLGIIFVSVFVSTLGVVFLRHVSEPARFAHDGGILMTEQAMKWLLEGKNVYLESFVGTPMEAHFPNEPSLTHYPYLPWTFLFPLPFYVAGNALFGWFDMRFIYLLQLGIMVGLAPALARSHTEKLILVAFLGLNPIMANDIIFGLNDIFILFWMFLGVYFFVKKREKTGLVMLGLAAASKFTAWFFLPFLMIYLCQFSFRYPFRLIPSSLRKSIPIVLAALPSVIPFALWDLGGMFEDVWTFNVGGGATPVLIKGVGFANVPLALGWVSDKTSFFPFWIPELVVGLPVLLFLVLWQQKVNTLGRAIIAHSVFFFLVIYFSRTMNPNYIGYIMALFAMGYLVKEETGETELYRHEEDAVSYENTSVGRG